MVMKTVLNVKVDPYVKREAQILSKSLGLPLSVVVNDSLRNFVDNQQITFSRFTPNKKFDARLKKIEHDTRLGKNISPAFSSMNEAIKYLHSKSK
jgi:antitoxin component of RelBE/YafQ-DinJ toxin-antitoxin module